jgi:hypothetical protein
MLSGTMGAPMAAGLDGGQTLALTMDPLGGDVRAGRRFFVSASVTGDPGFDPAPTAQVTFYDGDAVLGTAWFDGDDHAALDVQLFVPGTHQLHAILSGEPTAGDLAGIGEITVLPAAVIDLMVLYTADVTTLVDGRGQWTSELRADIDSVNEAFDNSGIAATLNLVHVQQVDYVSTGNYSTDLYRLRNPSDGYMDEAAYLRRLHGADLVSLFVAPYGTARPDDPPGTRVLGIGTELMTAGGNAEAAFSVIHAGSAGYGDYTLAHELGHNLGASHDHANNTPPNPAFPNGEGYRFFDEFGNLVHDIMAYDPGETIPYFSNPDVVYGGVAEGQRGVADAAHVIMRTAPVVAKYYQERGAIVSSVAPRGAVEIRNRNEVSGWAYDGDMGARPVRVRLDIDGQQGLLQEADLSRPDLAAKLGSADHGFRYDLSRLGPGRHTITVYAINEPAGGETCSLVLLARFALTNPAPGGALDVVNAAAIAGWAWDRDMPAAALQVRIDVDGATGAVFTADMPRVDVVRRVGSANHGFCFDLGAELYQGEGGDTGPHKVQVYFYDADTGLPYLFKTLTVRTKDVPPTGRMLTGTSASVTGWAFDPNASGGTVGVVLTIDDQYAGEMTANEEIAALRWQVGSTAHGFTLALPQDLALGRHAVKVWARNSPEADPAGPMKLLGRYTVVNHAPMLGLEVANGTTVAGWLDDPDMPAMPLAAYVEVDGGVWQNESMAEGVRPDLEARLGSANHGFACELPSDLAYGRHTVTLYGFDAQSNERVRLRTVVVNRAEVPPTGQLEVVNGDLLSGWAYDLNAGAQSILVKVEVDGVEIRILPADETRDDLMKRVGSTNHGFTCGLGLAPGKHTIRVWMCNAPDERWVLLKAVALTVPPVA